MNIKFITTNKEFADEIKANSNYKVDVMHIQKYIETKGHHTFYVSPANSLGYMDGGIDESLSEMFPSIGKKVRDQIEKHGKIWNKTFRYLPIGSAIIIPIDQNRSLISAPTMLTPQDVRHTKNAYYATMATLYTISKTPYKNIDVILTSMCCGCGAMSGKKSVEQILNAIKDYPTYKPEREEYGVVINEPNLKEQPKFEYPFGGCGEARPKKLI